MYYTRNTIKFHPQIKVFALEMSNRIPTDG